MKKYKIFVCLLILFGIVLSFVPSVFATSDVGFVYTDDNGNVFNLPVYPEGIKEYNHYVVIKTTIWNEFYLLPFNETFEVTENSNTYFDILLDGVKASELYWWCSFSNGVPDSWSLCGHSLGGTGFVFSKTNNPFYVVDTCSCLKPYANNLDDVLKSNESFFMNRQGVLVPIMEKAPLAEVMKEIMVILPVIILTLVGLIGLRKALRMLSTVLHRS